MNSVTVNTVNIALRDTWFPRLRLSGQRKPVSCPGPPVLRAARAVSTSDRAWWMGTGFHCHEPALGKATDTKETDPRQPGTHRPTAHRAFRRPVPLSKRQQRNLKQLLPSIRATPTTLLSSPAPRRLLLRRREGTGAASGPGNRRREELAVPGRR